MLVLQCGRGIDDPFYSGPLPLLPKQTIGQLGKNSSYEAAFVRLLLGAADIVDIGGGTLVVQRNNFFVLGAPRFSGRTETGVRRALAALGIPWKELDRYLKLHLSKQAYFKEVLQELVECLCRENQGAHTLAFLHMYRLLERMSFVFPFLYAARASNFAGAFSVLRDYFKSGAESELSLLRAFQESSLDNADKEAPIELDFSSLDASVINTAHAVVRRCVDGADIKSDAPPKVELKSQGLLNLLINLRNRYFHFSVSNAANIKVSELGNSDVFFAVVNKPLLNWLGVIYLAVLEERIR